MIYNFNDLLFIFSASEKSTRVKGGFISEEYSLTIAKGNYAGSFAIYSKDNSSSPVFLEIIRNIKSLEHYDNFVKITFRNNSFIKVFRSLKTTIDYSDYVNDYIQYNDGIGVLESVIRKDVRIPGTNILLEKGDRIVVRNKAKHIKEAYNEDRLAKALGCRSLNFENLPMNEDLGLLVYDGEKQGVFYLADNSTGSIEFTGFYRDILEAFYDRSGKSGVIRFKDGSSIVIHDLGGFLDIEKRNFESAYRKSNRVSEAMKAGLSCSKVQNIATPRFKHDAHTKYGGINEGRPVPSDLVSSIEKGGFYKENSSENDYWKVEGNKRWHLLYMGQGRDFRLTLEGAREDYIITLR